MKRTQLSVRMAGLLAALALAGCSSPPSGANRNQMGTASTTTGNATNARTGTADPANAIGSNTTTDATAGNSGTAAKEMSPGIGSMTEQQGAMGTGKMSGMMASNAVVITVESMPRQGSSAAAGAAVGSSGSMGTTGSSMVDDKTYRITLRMDDGSTRVITQEKTPAFGAGDRVNMTDGTISNAP